MIVKATCRTCGDIQLNPGDVTVWHWASEATYTHCGLDHVVRLDADRRLTLTVYGAHVVNGEDLERQVTA